MQRFVKNLDIFRIFSKISFIFFQRFLGDLWTENCVAWALWGRTTWWRSSRRFSNAPMPPNWRVRKVRKCLENLQKVQNQIQNRQKVQKKFQKFHVSRTQSSAKNLQLVGIAMGYAMQSMRIGQSWCFLSQTALASTMHTMPTSHERFRTMRNCRLTRRKLRKDYAMPAWAVA